MKTTIKAFATLILFSMFGFTATAFAAGEAAPDNESLLDLARPVFDAVVHGQWWVAASAGVILACALARKYLPDAYKTGIKGDLTGTGMAFAVAFAGAIATWAAAPGAAMSGAVLLTALKVGAVAIGGYTILHKLATAFVATTWFKAHAPSWVVFAATYALKFIGSNAIEKAEAAGAAAVKANPAPGAAPGKFEEF
jgi:hypothetical protein